MGSICPTVLAGSPEEYREQMGAVASFADRIQIDLGDGIFTTKTVAIPDVWWPEGVLADIHLMYQAPLDAVRLLLQKKPHMIIVHAESTGDIENILDSIRNQGVLAGIALLQPTAVETVHSLIEHADHTLIFSGALGSFGGTADLALLGKVPQIRAIKPTIEIGWDGGANVDNAARLAGGGIDVINVGGAIQKALRPENAYRMLERQVYD